jgi:tripartite-type tricarboxylate transporter receptor subunit TctC
MKDDLKPMKSSAFLYVCLLLVAVCLELAAAPAAGQTFPAKSVRIIVPFPAGGSGDIIARTVAQPVSRALGQNVIIDNRPGGTGLIGAELVARSPADGYTILFIGTVFSINPSVRVKMPYDTLKDFTGIARIASNPMVFAAHPSLPARSLKELIALARARPGLLTYATNGPASPQHLSMEMFKALAKIDLIHVPYQGGAPATIAVMGGHTMILVANLSEGAPHLETGKLRALAVTSAARSELFAQIPTVAEAGFPGFDLNIWYGTWAPAATPRDAVNRLSAEINRALQLQDVQDTLGRIGLNTAGMNATDFDAFYRAEVRRFETVAKAVNLKID